MKRIKIFSNYDFTVGYHCPCCGKLIESWDKLSGDKPMITPIGKLEECLLTCPECHVEIDYLQMVKK